MKRIGMLILVMVLFVTTAFAETAVVTGDVVNLRQTPQGEIIGKVRRGETVTIISGPDRNNYYQVTYKGGTYYIYGEYIDVGAVGTTESQTTTTQSKPKKKATPKTVETKINFCYIAPDECECQCKGLMFVCAKNRLALRRRTTQDSRRLDWLYHGTPVIILDPQIKNGFVKVQTMEGIEGYAFAKYLSADPIGDVTYVYESCEDYGCCDATECWASVSWYVSE